MKKLRLKFAFINNQKKYTMYKIKHALKNLMFGQIDKYNSITVEFECKDRIVTVKKTASVTISNWKNEQTIFVN